MVRITHPTTGAELGCVNDNDLDFFAEAFDCPPRPNLVNTIYVDFTEKEYSRRDVRGELVFFKSFHDQDTTPSEMEVTYNEDGEL